MAREKRSFTRITLNIQTSISLYQIEAYRLGVITNISLSGCFFPFVGELPIGEDCYLTITTGEGLETEQVSTTGIIVRNDLEGVGIKFTDTSPQIRHQLEKIISRETVR